MAAPPTLGPLTLEAMPGAPGWLEKLLKPLNPFVAAVRGALTKGLTPGDNMDAAWLEVTLTAPTLPEAIPTKTRGAAHGVFLARVRTLEGSAPSAAPAILWEAATRPEAGGGHTPCIRLTAVSGLTSGSRYSLRLLVLAE